MNSKKSLAETPRFFTRPVAFKSKKDPLLACPKFSRDCVDTSAGSKVTNQKFGTPPVYTPFLPVTKIRLLYRILGCKYGNSESVASPSRLAGEGSG